MSAIFDAPKQQKSESTTEQGLSSTNGFGTLALSDIPRTPSGLNAFLPPMQLHHDGAAYGASDNGGKNDGALSGAGANGGKNDGALSGVGASGGKNDGVVSKIGPTGKNGDAKNDIGLPEPVIDAGMALGLTPVKPSPHKEWTVAVNLAINAFDSNGSFDASNKQKAEGLIALAAQTKDTPVRIVAQVVVSDPNPNDGAHLLERFKIENGKIERLSDTPSIGYSEDLASLLKVAAGENSKSLALFNFSHGGADEGLEGAAGTATLDEFSNGIKKGLDGSNHKKLDLIDLDSCLMGANNVLEKLKGVTDNVVASSEIESSFPGRFDAQNLSATIESLIKNPGMNGSQLGDAAVDVAKAGSNGPKKQPDSSASEIGPAVKDKHPDPDIDSTGTCTLSHYDLTKLGKFDDAFNRFGENLAQKAKDPEQLATLQKIIDSTPRFTATSSDPAEASCAQRDLQSFAKRVEAAIKDGSLKDPHHSLETSVQELMKTHTDLVQSYFGQKGATGYDNMGGLSVFLPGTKYVKPASFDVQTPINDLAELPQRMKAALVFDRVSKEALPGFQRESQAALDALKHRLVQNAPADAKEQLKSLDAAFDHLHHGSQSVAAPGSDQSDNAAASFEILNLETNSSPRLGADYSAALSQVSRAARDLQSSDLNKKIAETILHQVDQEHRDVLRQEEHSGNEGWNRFLSALDPTSKKG